MKKLITYIFSVIIVTMLLNLNAFSQTAWVAPEEAQAIVNPLQPTPDIVAAGKDIFTKNCQVCHGIAGENKPLAIPPVSPRDIADAIFQNQTNGSLFFKISNGRGGMPQFKTVLKEEQLWSLIHYIRTFSGGIYPGAGETAVADSAKYGVQQVKLKAIIQKAFVDGDTVIQFIASVTSIADGSPVAGVPVSIAIKRLFGEMAMGDGSKKTGTNGQAVFYHDDNLAGDSTGNVQLVARITDEYYKGSTIVEQVVNIGKPTIPKNLLEERSLWTVRTMAPWWIYLLYFGITIGIWIFIFYVVFLITRLKSAGKPTQ